RRGRSLRPPSEDVPEAVLLEEPDRQTSVQKIYVGFIRTARLARPSAMHSKCKTDENQYDDLRPHLTSPPSTYRPGARRDRAPSPAWSARRASARRWPQLALSPGRGGRFHKRG